MDNFPGECKSPKLTQLKTEHLKKLISIEGIKKVSQGNTLPYAIGPEGCTGRGILPNLQTPDCPNAP